MLNRIGCFAAPTPRVLWVELTSKCPADCVFCSRRTRRGAGVHLPIAVFSDLVGVLRDARRFVLNYSGESTVYPELLEAIQSAKATGAYVELVSVLTTAPESLLEPLSRSGLNRLTVSVHAADPERYKQVYRYSSVETLRARLQQFLSLCAEGGPLVDFGFVAMDANLAELPGVVALASELGVAHVAIFPVMRRDEIPIQFPIELTPQGEHRPEFGARIESTAEEARHAHPAVRVSIANELPSAAARVGQVPAPFGGTLPEGACIHSCEQNPWESIHVLSNGDIVPCEVLDKRPMGNLFENSITAIWNGELYREFREQYRHGRVAECRTCPWKRAYLPASLDCEIHGERSNHAQLVYGWHEQSSEQHVWSSQQAMAILQPRKGSRTLHVSGLLPPGPHGKHNTLSLTLNGEAIGTFTNQWEEVVPFGLDFEAPHAGDEIWKIEFRTAHVCRPFERGMGSDQRDLGFGLVLLASQQSRGTALGESQQTGLQALRTWIADVDRWGMRAARRLPRRSANGKTGRLKQGISVIIPERDNRTELAACLESLDQAVGQCGEPVETIVVASGATEQSYAGLRHRFPAIHWEFIGQPLDFQQAVHRGLRAARFDWAYLLNNDVAIEAGALRELASLRESHVFAVASQIFLKDTTRFREETNWAALLVESGLATIHDWIPRSAQPVPTFYAGGGASLFRRKLLLSLLDTGVYAPFYWEDVEWGWRARKLGYHSVFCPASVAHHRQRSTINRDYPPAEVEEILRRNRLLFQMRNFTTAGSLERVLEEIGHAGNGLLEWFLQPRTRWSIARGRFWNHRAALTDEEVFEKWNSSISNC